MIRETYLVKGKPGRRGPPGTSFSDWALKTIELTCDDVRSAADSVEPFAQLWSGDSPPKCDCSRDSGSPRR